LIRNAAADDDDASKICIICVKPSFMFACFDASLFALTDRMFSVLTPDGRNPATI
jgi:hypothetical protein